MKRFTHFLFCVDQMQEGRTDRLQRRRPFVAQILFLSSSMYWHRQQSLPELLLDQEEELLDHEEELLNQNKYVLDQEEELLDREEEEEDEKYPLNQKGELLELDEELLDRKEELLHLEEDE